MTDQAPPLLHYFVDLACRGCGAKKRVVHPIADPLSLGATMALDPRDRRKASCIRCGKVAMEVRTPPPGRPPPPNPSGWQT